MRVQLANDEMISEAFEENKSFICDCFSCDF
ncbi:hypothetical protein SAMN05428962_2796 [Paenibacillus sp. BC26]|nr:hypothetical protein SAMN05428962_2796 [Paenibacillus sp. BC26]